MSKKVYKNKLERDMEERKEERRKSLGDKTKKSQKSDRMEEMYKKLSSMTEDDIKERKEEIDKKLSNLEKEARGRTDNGRKVEKEVAKHIISEAKKCKKEKEQLENFSKVKNQIQRIRSLRDKTVARRKKNLLKAKQELKDLKAELKEIETKTKKINELTIKVERYQTNFAKDIEITDEDREGYINALKELQSINQENNAQTQANALKTRLKTVEKKVKLYETGKSEEDAVINKCNMAWKMLLAGKSWDEISLAAMEEVKQEEPKSQQNINNQTELKGKTQKTAEQGREKESKSKASELDAEDKTEKNTDASKDENLNKKPKFKIWSKIKEGFKKLVDYVKPLPLPEASEKSNKDSNKEMQGEEDNIQRDAFIQALKVYANKEEVNKKQFGGLEVERKAYERIAKNEIEQNEEELAENLRSLKPDNSKEESEQTR